MATSLTSTRSHAGLSMGTAIAGLALALAASLSGSGCDGSQPRTPTEVADHDVERGPTRLYSGPSRPAPAVSVTAADRARVRPEPQAELPPVEAKLLVMSADGSED